MNVGQILSYFDEQKDIYEAFRCPIIIEEAGDLKSFYHVLGHDTCPFVCLEDGRYFVLEDNKVTNKGFITIKRSGPKTIITGEENGVPQRAEINLSCKIEAYRVDDHACVDWIEEPTFEWNCTSDTFKHLASCVANGVALQSDDTRRSYDGYVYDGLVTAAMETILDCHSPPSSDEEDEDHSRFIRSLGADLQDLLLGNEDVAMLYDFF